MDDQGKVIKVLRKDLRNEYGIAIRYLFMANEFKRRDDEATADIMYDLASDSVSHSLLVKNMLIYLGERPPTNITAFNDYSPNLDRSLTSSYLLERKMARDYNNLARELGKDHKFYRLLISLGRWEGEHMSHVLRAIRNRRERTVEDSQGNIYEKLTDLQDVIHEAVEEEDPLGMDIDREVLKAELGIVNALENFADPTVLDRLSENIMGGGFANLGVPAETVVPEEDVPLLWEGVDDKYTAYCVKCREKHVVVNPIKVIVAGSRPGVKGVCPHCNTGMFALV